MGIYRIKPQFQKALQPITNWLVNNKVSPDWMTYGAVATAAVMAGLIVFAAQGQRGWLVLVAAGVPVRLAMNALDGQVSRALNVADSLGEVKNELSDRVADALIFAGLVLTAPNISLPLSVAALIVTFLTGYIGILSKAVSGVRDYSGVMGKPDRMTAVAVGAVLVAITGSWVWLSVALGVVIALGLYTIVVRLRSTARRLNGGA